MATPVQRAWSYVLDTVRTQLWPLPVVATLVAVVAGIYVPRFDARFDASLPGWLTDLIFGGDAGAARTVLDSVSSSLITVTSLTFSLTVVTLQLASSQFSPRLLRTFTSDVMVQSTLALFLATFTYALTALRAVRSDDVGSSFVPRLAVTLAFVLAVFSVVQLVLFLAHLARQIRVETMLSEVHRDATTTLRLTLSERGDGPAGALPPAPEHADLLFAEVSGFLLRFDEDALVNAAEKYDAIVALDCCPGSSLVYGTPVGSVWGRQGPLRTEDSDRLRALVVGAIKVGFERTAAQDVGYGLRLLTDVANKALSPGINDPTTAVYTLGHISALLCELTERDLGPTVLESSAKGDTDGVIRVGLARPDLAELVDVAITQPRRYGASDPQVMERLFGLLGELAWHVTPDQQHVVTSQLRRLRDTVGDQDFDDVETARLDDAAHDVERALVGARTERRRTA